MQVWQQWQVVDSDPLVCDPSCKPAPPFDVGNWSFALTEHFLLVPPKQDFLMHRQLVLHPRHDALSRIFSGINRVDGDGADRSVHAEVEGVIVTVEAGYHHSAIIGAGGVELASVVNRNLVDCDGVSLKLPGRQRVPHGVQQVDHTPMGSQQQEPIIQR